MSLESYCGNDGKIIRFSHLLRVGPVNHQKPKLVRLDHLLIVLQILINLNHEVQSLNKNLNLTQQQWVKAVEEAYRLHSILILRRGVAVNGEEISKALSQLLVVGCRW